MLIISSVRAHVHIILKSISAQTMEKPPLGLQTYQLLRRLEEFLRHLLSQIERVQGYIWYVMPAHGHFNLCGMSIYNMLGAIWYEAENLLHDVRAVLDQIE